jgi:hypothetical protein
MWLVDKCPEAICVKNSDIFEFLNEMTDGLSSSKSWPEDQGVHCWHPVKDLFVTLTQEWVNNKFWGVTFDWGSCVFRTENVRQISSAFESCNT